MTPWFQKLVSRINFGFNFPPQGVPIWRSITTPRQRSQPKNLVSYMRKHFKSLHKVWDTWFQIRRICWRKNVLQMTLFSPMMVSELITCFHEFLNYEFCFRGFRELTFLIRISEFIRCFHQFVSRIFLRWPVEKETIINIPRFGIEDWWNYLMNSLNNSYIGNFHLLHSPSKCLAWVKKCCHFWPDQNFEPSLLTNKLWLIFMGKKQKKVFCF